MNLPKHNPDPTYLRELLARAGLSQRGAARLVMINERTMRYYCSGQLDLPYTTQLALEFIAHIKKAAK